MMSHDQLTPERLCGRIIEILSDGLDVQRDRLPMHARFSEDLDAIELDQIHIVEDLEKEFEITIPDEPIEKIRTVGECVKYIGRLCAVEGIDQYVDTRAKQERLDSGKRRAVREEKWQQRYEAAGFFGKLLMRWTR